MEECYQTISMSANQSNPRRRENTDIKWTVVVVVVLGKAKLGWGNLCRISQNSPDGEVSVGGLSMGEVLFVDLSSG